MKKALLTLLALLLCAGLLTGCMKEEECYKKTDVDGFVASLKAEIAEKNDEVNAKIAALRTECETKISANETEISNLKTKLANDVAAVKNETEHKISEINGLIAELQSANTDNVGRIAQLEAQINEIEKNIEGLKATEQPMTLVCGGVLAGVPYYRNEAAYTCIQALGYIDMAKLVEVTVSADYVLVCYLYDENFTFINQKVNEVGVGVTCAELKESNPTARYLKIMVYLNNGASVTPEEAAKNVSVIGYAPINTLDKVNEAAKSTQDRFGEKFQVIAYSTVPGTIYNTAEHFLAVAKNSGFDMIKGDVRITSDNKLVMCHDAGFTFDDNGRITTFDSTNATLIRDMTYDEVMALEHAKKYEGNYVHPTDFDTFLQICKKYGKTPYITVRDEYVDVIAPIVVERLQYFNLERNCIVNSLTYSSLKAIRALSDCIILSHVQQIDSVLQRSAIDQMAELGNAIVTLYDSDCSNLDNETQLANMEYARSMGIRLWNAIVETQDNIDKLVEYGFAGCQSWVPYE